MSNEPMGVLNLRCECGQVRTLAGFERELLGRAVQLGWVPDGGRWECPTCRYAYESSFERVASDGRRGYSERRELPPVLEGVVDRGVVFDEE